MSAAVPAGVQRLDVLLDGSDAFGDAMDLPLIAFNVAAGCSEPVRSVLGEIIARESVVGLWNEHTATSPLQVFDAWAEQVRAVSMRLAGLFASLQHLRQALAPVTP